jgi:hypothetical protein
VRTNISTAKSVAAIAVVAYQAGRALDGAEALALAERALRDGSNQLLLPDADRGGRSRVGSHVGAKRKAESYVDRDIEMAREFLRRRRATPSAKMSDSALKVGIGKKKGLKRSAAIEAIDKGLEALGYNHNGHYDPYDQYVQ